MISGDGSIPNNILSFMKFCNVDDDSFVDSFRIDVSVPVEAGSEVDVSIYDGEDASLSVSSGDSESSPSNSVTVVGVVGTTLENNLLELEKGSVGCR